MSRDNEIFLKIRGRRRQGELVTGFVNGKNVIFRKAKTLPKGCKTPKRICIKCLATVILKQDKNYDLKICKSCNGDK